MNFHFLKISWRHLLRDKVFGLINLTGLAVGIASVLLISMYVHSELSFDSFFQDSDRIYRIPLHRVYPDRTRDFASSAITLAPVLKENYPEVEAVTRLHRMYFRNELPVQVGDRVFLEPRVRFADQDFFHVFSHPFLHGSPSTALDAEDKVVLTASTAIKYFGKTDVLNEKIQVGGDSSLFLISGVIQDIPINSHIHFEVLGSIQSVPYLVAAIENNRWINPWLYTYVKLHEGTNVEAFEAQLGPLVDTYGAAYLSQTLGEDYVNAGHRFDYILQPIQSIHLHSKMDIEVEPTSDITYIYLLSVIALIILAISSINYINLSVARSPVRAKEVGIRKVVGVQRHALIAQFLTESVLFCMLSAVLAVGLVYVCLPYFNTLLHTSLSLAPLMKPAILAAVFLFILVVGMLSGFYPAIVIAAIQPSWILKGSFKSSKKGSFLRNGLTTLQFVISIVMISGSLLVHQQMSFFRNKNLGFEQENLLVLDQTNLLDNRHAAFREEVAKLPGVVSIGGANGLPGDFHGSNIYKAAQAGMSDLRAYVATFDDYVFETMAFRVLQGRSFDPAFNDSLSIIINEATARSIGLDDPIGARFRAASGNEDAPFFTIIGVVEDYHFYSLHDEIGPMVIFNGNQRFVPPKMAVRLRTSNLSKSIAAIQAKWEEMGQGELNYSFLDQELQAQYESDHATGWVFDVFTFIALVMCCIGLFGLTTFMAQQRAKEMCIRKVLGASTGSIIMTFSKEFLRLIGLACMVGMPVAYWVMDEWLSGFAYHVEISVALFLLTAFIMLFLLMITMSYQSFKLATVNPVESLRNE